MQHYPLRRLMIENFQSIKLIDIELEGNGLYWIRGKNNVGKSAIIKAMSALFTNIANNKYKEMIRDGETTFNVKAWFGPDYVELSRGGEDYYEWIIDGESGRVDKTQGKVPDELVEYFNLYYEPDKTKRYLNLTGATESLLFTETTAGDNYRLLQKALGTEVLTKATKESDRIKRSILAENRTIEKLKLEKEEALPEQEQVKQLLTDRSQRLNQLKTVLDKEKGWYDVLAEQYENVDALTQLATALIDINQDINLYQELGIEKELAEQTQIEQVLRDQHQYRKLTEELGRIDAVLTGLETKEVVDLINQVKAIDTQLALHQNKQQLEQALTELNLPDDTELKEVQPLINETNQIEDVQRLFGELVQRLGALEQVNDELEVLSKEYESARQALGVCPYCGGDVTDSHSHSKGVAS